VLAHLLVELVLVAVGVDSDEGERLVFEALNQRL